MEKFFDRKQSSQGKSINMLRNNGQSILTRNNNAAFRSQKRANNYASVLNPAKQEVETWNSTVTFYRDRNSKPSRKALGSMSPVSRPSQEYRLKLPEL